MQDLRPAPPVADPHGLAGWWATTGDGWLEDTRNLVRRGCDSNRTGKEAPSAPRVAESQAHSRGRNIAG